MPTDTQLPQPVNRDTAAEAPAVRYVLIGVVRDEKGRKAFHDWLEGRAKALCLPGGAVMAAVDVANGRVLWEVRG
jgi:hypothetical protein